MPMIVSDPFFDTKSLPYKVISNPKDPNDKSLCILIQDASPFDGAVIKYTDFKLSGEAGDDDTVGCTYEYDFEIPPHDSDYEISDKEGVDFEKRLGEWVIEILQKQMKKMELDATKN